MTDYLSAAEGSTDEDPSKPEMPDDGDCCHSGCQNCVFDAYLLSLERWKRSKGERLARRYDLLSVTKFKPFVLVHIKKLTSNTNLYTFKPFIENSDTISGFLPYSAGQHLALRIDISELTNSNVESMSKSRNSHYIRDFTITSLSNKRNDCSFDMIIKLYKDSKTSNFLKSLGVGEVTYWRGPYGEYSYRANSHAHLVMFCMGTGVAPMYPIASEIVENDNDETVISLHFGCRNSYEIVLRDELESLASYWNFTCKYYLSNEKDFSNKRYREEFILNKITESVIRDSIIGKNNCFVLVCGSADFTNDVKDVLQKLNIDKYYLF